MTEDREPRARWVRDHALPLAKDGLPPRLIVQRLLAELPRGYEDGYLAPGLAKDVRDALKAVGLRPNVADAERPSAATYKQLEAFTFDEIVALAAHRDEQIDADDAAKLREIEQWCAAHDGYTVEQIVSEAKRLRAQQRTDTDARETA